MAEAPRVVSHISRLRGNLFSNYPLSAAINVAEEEEEEEEEESERGCCRGRERGERGVSAERERRGGRREDREKAEQCSWRID